MPNRTFTTLQMEAALCIWECFIDMRRAEDKRNAAFDSAWDQFGTVHMRHMSYTLAPLACDVWDIMTEEQRERLIPYDWTFIPEFVRCIDFATDFDHGGPHYIGDKDPVKILHKLLPDLPPEPNKAFIVRIKRNEYFDIAVKATSADEAEATAKELFVQSTDPNCDFAIWGSDWEVSAVDDTGEEIEGEVN